MFSSPCQSFKVSTLYNLSQTWIHDWSYAIFFTYLRCRGVLQISLSFWFSVEYVWFLVQKVLIAYCTLKIFFFNCSIVNMRYLCQLTFIFHHLNLILKRYIKNMFIQIRITRFFSSYLFCYFLEKRAGSGKI